MQGKVTMRKVVCYHCGRPRLTIAKAPWGQIVIICGGCKQMTQLEAANEMCDSEEGAAERGLPKSRGAAQPEPMPLFDGQEPEPEPPPEPPAPPEPDPEPIPQRPRRRPPATT